MKIHARILGKFMPIDTISRDFIIVDEIDISLVVLVTSTRTRQDHPFCPTILSSTTSSSQLKGCRLSLSFLNIIMMFHFFDLESKSLRQALAIF